MIEALEFSIAYTAVAAVILVAALWALDRLGIL